MALLNQVEATSRVKNLRAPRLSWSVHCSYGDGRLDLLTRQTFCAKGKWTRSRLALIFGLLFFPFTTEAAPDLTEYQVKALFLLNFAKYVEWPTEAFPSSTTPMLIGFVGRDDIKNDLTRIAGGKTINGHLIAIKQFSSEDNLGCCHILFISASEAGRLPEILAKTATSPILTVGETSAFNDKGGIINFVMKEGKVRLEIQLHAARKGKLQISSKLLSVADVVLGK